MNSSRFETYDAMRADVLAFIESRTGSRMTETKVHKHDKTRDDPMDVDSVVKGKGKNKFSGVARSATRPQCVGQEIELQTKIRVEIRVRM